MCKIDSPQIPIKKGGGSKKLNLEVEGNGQDS
jgi:hypothetical protein